MNCELTPTGATQGERREYVCTRCGRRQLSRQDDAARIHRRCTAASPPGLLRRAARFAGAALAHAARGNPTALPEEIDRRFGICQACEHFTTPQPGQHRCTQCGCRISDQAQYLNKLAWADQKCPADKWGPV